MSAVSGQGTLRSLFTLNLMCHAGREPSEQSVKDSQSENSRSRLPKLMNRSGETENSTGDLKRGEKKKALRQIDFDVKRIALLRKQVKCDPSLLPPHKVSATQSQLNLIRLLASAKNEDVHKSCKF